MSRFASDHVIEVLRDTHRPTRSQIKRIFARRAARLTRRINEMIGSTADPAIWSRPAVQFTVQELSAIAAVMELLTEVA